MEILPYPNWKKVSRDELFYFLANQNYLRDAWANCDIFERVGTRERLGAIFTDGRCYIVEEPK